MSRKIVFGSLCLAATLLFALDPTAHAAESLEALSTMPEADAAPADAFPRDAARVDGAKGPAHPFGAGQEWYGHYLCAQGETALTLRVTLVSGNHIEAIFDFAHGPTGVRGSYSTRGDFDPKTGRLRLDPNAWIFQPPGYIMVGLEGTVSARKFEGLIAHWSCGAFAVQPSR